MRVLLASLVLLALGPAAAQQKPVEAAGAIFSPTLMEGWQFPPIYPTAEESVRLALAWAEAPNGRFVQYSTSPTELVQSAKQFGAGNSAVAARPPRSTVGQGDH